MTENLSDEQYRELLEQERARQQVHPLDWQDDFGPLKYTQLAELVRHQQRLDREPDRRKQDALAVELGYRDAIHLGRVRATFLKYHGHPTAGLTLGTFSWIEPAYAEAVAAAAAMDRVESAAPPAPAAKVESAAPPAASARPAAAPVPTPPSRDALTAPEEGITLEQYASLCAVIAARQPGLSELQEMLAPRSMDLAKWERVNRAWVTRMLGDTTLTLNQLFARSYAAAGAGHFSAATPAPPPAEPVASVTASAPAPAPASPRSPAPAKAAAGTEIMVVPELSSLTTPGAPAPASVKAPTSTKAPGSGPTPAPAPASVKVPAAAMHTAPMQTVRGPEPMPLARFAEIGVAMSVWANRNRDTAAMLSHVYHMTPAELSTVSMYWQRRFEAEAALLAEYSRLQDALKAKFSDPTPDADLHY